MVCPRGTPLTVSITTWLCARLSVRGLSDVGADARLGTSPVAVDGWKTSRCFDRCRTGTACRADPRETVGRWHRRSGRQTKLLDCRTLRDKTSIQLVSAADREPNDLVLASVARREGADFLLRGEVMENSRRLTSDGKHEDDKPEDDP